MNQQTQLTTVIAGVVILIGLLFNHVYASERLFQSASTTLQVQKTDHIRGNPDAGIIVFEFSDYECPYCKQHHETLQNVVQGSNGTIAWVYKHFPLSMNGNGQLKAEASECVGELGGNDAFWAFADSLFESGTDTPTSELGTLAAKVDIDMTKFDTCLASRRYTQKVNADRQLGTSLGVQGTPGNIIVNMKTGKQQFISGALPEDQLIAVIEDLK